MVDEKEFFAQADEGKYTGPDEVIDPALVNALKTNRDELMQLYAKLILNPYLAAQLLPDFRSNLLNTAATLMEHGIPLDADGKIREPGDVVKEGLAELGGMLGGKIFGSALKAKKRFEESMQKAAYDFDEDVEIYRDPNDGSYYFIDPETGDEIDCDPQGNPLE